MNREHEMTVSEIMVKMIVYSQGNPHDINHFLKVYAYAKTIAECEGVAPFQQKTVEIAAILHDIACPLCREKYGNTNGKRQEAEGAPLAETVFTAASAAEVLRKAAAKMGKDPLLQAANLAVKTEKRQLLQAVDLTVKTEKCQLLQTANLVVKTGKGLLLQTANLAVKTKKCQLLQTVE